MSVPTIFGKASRADILGVIGKALLQVKCDRELTLDKMGETLGRDRDMVAHYIAGESEMGVVAWLRANAAWPELVEKLEAAK